MVSPGITRIAQALSEDAHGTCPEKCSLDAVTQAFAYQLDFMDFLKSGNYSSTVRTFANQKNLKQQACISGTSHKPDSTERTDLFGMLQAGGTSFKDTARPNWRDTMVKLVQDFAWVEHYVKFVDNIETMAECCRAIISTSDSAATRSDISP